VGRAIVRKPSVFLFDEPLSNLDAKLRVQMRTEIKKLHARLKTTMIYVTHDQVEAMTMGDRIVVLKDGYIMQAAPPLEIYKNPANRFVAGFIGSPAMNFLDVQVELGASPSLSNPALKLSLSSDLAQKLKPYGGKAVTMGIRPEHLDIGKAGEGIQVTMDVSELMGNESYLYSHAGETEIVARVQDNTPRKPGEVVSLVPNMDELHFFEAESGERI
jgi:multiple sugar transport system ATP-binding protein